MSFRSWKTATLAAWVLLLACDDGSYYLFNGNEYEPTRDCLDPSAALDVFAGSDPGASCTVECIVQQISATDNSGHMIDGGVAVFVSDECGPPPPGTDVSGTNPQCVSALAAWYRTDICLDGGGSTDPIPDAGPPDASPDALSVDAETLDAQNDVNTD
jgi:hypothetical protein